MIVDMQKYLIYGAKDQMDRFFALAQRAGFIEFIGIWHKKALEMPQHVRSILSAIKILRAWMGADHGIELAILSNPVLLAERVVQLNHSLEKQLEEERVLLSEIARIAPFGDFSKTDVVDLEKEARRVLQFFCMKSEISNETTLPSELIWVATEYDLDYYVAITSERRQYPKMIEILIDRPVGVLRSELHETQVRIAGLEAELKCLAVNLPFLQEGLIDALNDHHLQSAKHDASFPMGSAVFAIEAWVPATHAKGLDALISGLAVYCEQISIEPQDKIPTCMENRGAAKIGEDLVHIYDTPSTHDKDPSLWVLIFFSLFFAMIISDAGYGLIYLLLGLFLRWKFAHIGGYGRRMIRLFIILATSCIIWGIASSSMFGLEFAPDNPLRRFSVMDYLVRHKTEYVMSMKDNVYMEFVHRFPKLSTATDAEDFLEKAMTIQDGKEKFVAMDEFTDNIMIELSIVVGILHLSFSFARSLRRHWSGVGWIACMIGGYLFFPATVLKSITIANFMGWVTPELGRVVGEAFLYGGFIFALIATCIQYGIKYALDEAMHVTKVFGDVLSYLRLYALGLAGVLMASTFNSLGADFGMVGGIFIIAFGHLANLGICLMAGVIHGLRLNFLEWYHFCFEGGGRLFHPLQMRRPKI